MILNVPHKLKASTAERVEESCAAIENLAKEIQQVIIGQSFMVERLLIGLLGSGHILLEGVPGLAKTLAVKSLASAIEASFSRIQFTPDLLPSDITGTTIYNIETNTFLPKKGPIFANFILADEINRTPEKVQSALLEAMQEKQVTIGEYTFKLEEPFLVLATQNPIDQRGTYTLPEAQIDRFMLKVIIDYPKQEEEKLIIRQNLRKEAQTIRPVISIDQIIEAKKVITDIHLDEKIEDYILKIVFATRYPAESGFENLVPLIKSGASPRGSINLAIAAKVYAFLNKRDFVIPEDIKEVCKDVLRHRIGLSYEAEANNVKADEIISTILNGIHVP